MDATTPPAARVPTAHRAAVGEGEKQRREVVRGAGRK